MLGKFDFRSLQLNMTPTLHKDQIKFRGFPSHIKNSVKFILVFGISPSVLYLLADVSEHPVGYIFWVEVIKEIILFDPSDLGVTDKCSETSANKYNKLDYIRKTIINHSNQAKA
jgi:hypothetical protein